MNSVLFINPDLHRSSEGILSLVARFDLYGKAIQENSSNRTSKIVLLAGITRQEFQLVNDLNLESLKVIRVGNPSSLPLLFAIRARRVILRDQIRSKIIVSSDLYFGFLASYLISKLLNQKQFIQISVHGNVLRQDEFLLVRMARKIYLNFVFRNSHSIRFVSDFLYKEVSAIFPVADKNNFIAPIPIEVGYQNNHVKKEKVLAFVGRLHSERGVKEWVEIAAKLLEERTDFRIKICGDGPLSEEMRFSLMKKFNKEQVDFLGRLDRNRMNSEWNAVKVLLSSAPSEGYGLAIREALTSSTFVCARESGGVTTLSNEYGEVVKTYRDSNEAVEIISAFLDEDFPIAVSNSFRLEIQQSNMAHMKILVSSWL
ncbi:RfaG Glycosyltransferase [Candidatus Nanopelagicaceae bacterium]